MRFRFARILACILIVSLLTGLANMTGFSAGTPGFTDIKGHWAETALLRAVGEGFLQGSDQKLRPNDPVTRAELTAILTRAFSAVAAADVSAVTDLAQSDWYYDTAAKGVAMGILAPEGGLLRMNETITRKEAFLMLAEAFQLTRAGQDASVLSSFSDGAQLAGRFRLAASALAGGGYIKGNGGQLHIDAPLTRAELMTVFYNIVTAVHTSGQAAFPEKGGVMLSGLSSLSDITFPGVIYFGGTAADVSLQSIDAEAVVLRSQTSSLHISASHIGRLVLAAGGDLVFNNDPSCAVGTLVIGAGTGTVTLGGTLQDVEITGSGRTVILSSPVKNLMLGGSGNTVVIAPGVAVGTVKIFSPAAGNTVKLDGTISACEVFGPGTILSGSGIIEKFTDSTTGCVLSVSAGSKTANTSYGLNGAALALTAPDTLPPGEALTASVTATSPFPGKACRGAWYLDGRFIAGMDLVLNRANQVPLSIEVPRTSEVPVNAVLSFVLSYDGDGGRQELRAEKSITLEPQTRLSPAEVLKTVTTGYKGNYTLAWAEKHDYDAALKEDWVNLKGYSSKTGSLVWISLAYQRVNVFSGSSGKWKLEKTFIIGSGAPGTDTPTGVFKVIGRNTKGWTTKEYTVTPLVFFNNYAYAFHSRLYYPKTTKLLDKRIGFPISHGCIRMYDEDVAWMYDNIPTGTTVVAW
jgi:lipoprotein-anchoring transpeptidase ErfK/SrfK